MALIRKHVAIIIIVIFFIAAMAVLFFIFRKTGSEKLSPVSLHVMPDLVFKNLDAQDITVSSLRGRPIVFHLWASWCVLCMREISDLVTLQKEFGDHIVIIEVNRRESSDIIKKYRDQLDAGHALLFVVDGNDSLYEAIKGFSMPETIFVDLNGEIRDHTRGPVGLIDIKRRIQDSFGL